MKQLLIIHLLLFSYLSYSQNLFIENYPSNENYRVQRVKQDFNGNFVLSGYKDVIAQGAMRPFVLKVSSTGQRLDSAVFFSGMPYDWYIMDVLIDSSFYYFIGFSGNFYNTGHGPNDSSMFLLKTDYYLNTIDTSFFPIVNGEDINHGTSKFDYQGNIVTAGYYINSSNHFGSFISKFSKDGDFFHSSIVPVDSNRWFTNLMVDSSFYYAFGYIWSTNLPRLLYKFDTLLSLVDVYNIPPEAQKYYSPIYNHNKESYFTSGFVNSSTIPVTRKYAIVESTIDGMLINNIEFGFKDSTNIPAFYDALCYQNGHLYYAGSVYGKNTLPPYGDNSPSNIYIAKLDTGLNIAWEKVVGGDAYYTAMNIIATSDGGVLLLASRNDITDSLNKLDIRLIKTDSLGNVTWIRNFDPPNLEISIFPNPADASIQLQFGSFFSGNLYVYNLQGQVILRRAIPVGNSYRLDTAELPTGMYFIYIQTADGRQAVKKLVVER